MGISSGEGDIPGLLARLRAPAFTKPTETSIARRKHAAILGADRVALIQTNLAADLGLKPDRIRRFEN